MIYYANTNRLSSPHRRFGAGGRGSLRLPKGVSMSATSRLLIFVLALGSVWSVLAQTDRGTIQGSVIDVSGVAVPGAQVTITQKETNTVFQFASNEAGLYFAANLPLGVYRVEVRKEGFRTGVQDNIIIQSQTRARVDWKLELGSVSESVIVSSEAPLVDASSATMATGLTTKFIEELPIIQVGRKRDITAFLRYLPGTTREATWGARVNGSAPGNSEVYIDGAPSSQGNVRGGIQENGPAVEHVGEFNVVTNAFNAEYGRTGSWFTNITIRSGTNDLHGSFFNYFANDKLSARSFFQPRRNVVRQNEGGLTIGGPVYIPKIYNGRNRTFFFFGQQLFYNRQVASGAVLTVPREDFRRGDFSNFRDASGNVIPVYDPTTTRTVNGTLVRDPFPGNIIPGNRISAVSRRIVDLMPAPDLPAAQVNNWFNRTGNAPRFDSFVSTVKGDHSISDRQKVSVTYSDQDRPRQIQGRGWGVDTPLEGLQLQDIRSRNGRINHDYIIRPNILNHFTFGADRYNNLSRVNTLGQGWSQQLGLTGLPYDTGAFPFVSFTGGTAAPLNVGGAENSQTANGRYSFNNNLAWTRGSHSMKFGFAYYREYQNSFEGRDAAGNYTFSNATTSSTPNATNGNAFASFLLGDAFATQTRSPIMLGWRFRYWAFFAQDEWRVNSKLTLSYGLRWELYPGAWEVNGRASSFRPDVPNPAAGGRLGALVFTGDGPGRLGTDKLSDDWNRGIAPRLGLAYSINPKTVVRASGGIYYAPGMRPRLPSNGFVSFPIFNSPDAFTGVTNWNQPYPQDFSRAPFIDPAFQNDQAVQSVMPGDSRAPQVLSWTFSLQREVAKSLALDASYIGSHSTHLIIGGGLSNRNVLDPQYLGLGSLLTLPINSPTVAAQGYSAPYASFLNQRNRTLGQALRPYPQFLNLQQEYAPEGVGRFHSLQLKLTKRYSSGLTFLTFYTWQKNMTNVETGPIDLGPGEGAVQNPLNRAGEVAVSVDGAPHLFTSSASYELPFGPGKSFLNRGGFVGRLVGGWQLVGFFRIGSGLPLVMTSQNNLAFLGFPNKRANYIGGQPVFSVSNPRDFDPRWADPTGLSADRYLNRNAFAVPAPYELGNTARTLDWARGWTLRNESVSIGKRTRITERVSTMLRADMENPFNFVRWNDPITNVSDANFGRVTGAQPGRLIQLSLSVEF